MATRIKRLARRALDTANRYVAPHVGWHHISRVPRGVYGRTEDWINHYTGKNLKRGACYQRISDGELIQRSLPTTIDSTIHHAFRDNLQYQSPSTFVASIPDARVWGHTAVISPNDYLLEDVSQWFGPSPVHPVFRRIKLPPAKPLDGKVVHLAAGGEGYFHWMFDVLPRLHLLSQADGEISDDALFLLNNLRDGYQRETIRRAGISEERVITLREHSHLQASKLTVPSFPGVSGHVPKWACDYVRSLFSDVLDDSPPHRRLYISRSQAKRRRVENEDEVRSFLEPLGFETVHLETMPVAEQAKLMNEATVVVGPHGAGLTNLVFCKPDTLVIELFSGKYVNECYWSLANQQGLNYFYVASTNPRSTSKLQAGNGNAHIQISLIDLQRSLESACKEKLV